MHTSEETQMLDDFLCPSVENPSIASSDQAQMSVSDSYSPQTNTQPVTAGQESKDERRHLWNVYTSQLVHSITAHHSDTANPLIDYLLPRALESSSFRSAILFLAFVMRTKQNGLSSLPYGKQSPAQTSAADAALGAHLENEALSDAALGISQPISMSRGLALEDSSKVTNAYTSLNTLATLVILCTAYIACGNSQSLMVFLEQAFLVAKMLSDELCSNEEYIFLVQYLGFIHTTAMLSPGGYDLKAPDFLTVLSNTDSALKRDFLEANQSAILTPTTSLRDDHFDAHKRSYQLERLAVQKMLRDFQSSCFDDITPTTGISNSVASLMYHVGRLSRLKSSVLNSCLPNEIHWFWGTFESDAEHLELQLGQMLRHRNNQSMIFETFVLKLDQLDDDYKDNHIQHAIDRTRYNDALLHCVRIVFMAKIKNTGARDPRILASTQRILNACSLVNDDSHTAGLLVFPLYTAGLYTDDLEARGFVKQRLISLNNRIVTDTDKLVRNLETCWQNPTGQTTNEQGMCYSPCLKIYSRNFHVDIDLCILY